MVSPSVVSPNEVFPNEVFPAEVFPPEVQSVALIGFLSVVCRRHASDYSRFLVAPAFVSRPQATTVARSVRGLHHSSAQVAQLHLTAAAQPAVVAHSMAQ